MDRQRYQIGQSCRASCRALPTIGMHTILHVTLLYTTTSCMIEQLQLCARCRPPYLPDCTGHGHPRLFHRCGSCTAPAPARPIPAPHRRFRLLNANNVPYCTLSDAGRVVAARLQQQSCCPEDSAHLAVHPPGNIFAGPIPDIQRSMIVWGTGIAHSLQQS